MTKSYIVTKYSNCVVAKAVIFRKRNVETHGRIRIRYVEIHGRISYVEVQGRIKTCIAIHGRIRTFRDTR